MSGENPTRDLNDYARVRYAERTHEMATEMYGMLPPWRWAEWFRRRREVNRRMAWLRETRRG